MRYTLLISLGAVLLLFQACTHSKPKPLVPLELTSGANAQAIALNTQGTQAFQGGQLAEAKNYFDQSIKLVPVSGQAHYNYALTLNALGESDSARQHFIEAANLAPGDKVIWDSPALRPFGSPAPPKGPPKEHPYGTRKPDIGTGPR